MAAAISVAAAISRKEKKRINRRHLDPPKTTNISKPE
jgi:hypothetical protein